MKKKFFAAIFLSASACVFAQNGKEKIARQLENYRKDAGLAHASYGFCVMNAATGNVVAEYNSELSLVPASTLKTLTTGAALALLGKDFRYETQLQYTGMLNETSGVLEGDLIIKGSGDPTLNSQYFRKKNDTTEVIDEWAEALKKKGLKRITGKIIADNSCFENDIPGTWIWADIGNYFGAPANGLSYNDNKYSLYFKSGKAGGQTDIIAQQPAVPGMEIDNQVKAGGNDDNAFIYGAPGTNGRVIKGTIPPNKNYYEVEGSLPDPALFCAQHLKAALIRAGIGVEGEAEVRSRKADTRAVTLYRHFSPPLEKIVFYPNMKRNNHYAETLLKTLAWKQNGLGTTAAGTGIVSGYWKEKGLDTGGLFMNDGSGLSRSNAVSTKIQAAVLSRIYADTAVYAAFNASLPVSGRSGGMAGIGKGSFAEGNMRAKSGYITRARAYCGYLKTRQDEELCFSLIFNNYSCSPQQVRAKMEDLLLLFCEL